MNGSDIMPGLVALHEAQEAALDLEQARTHAAQLIIAAIEKQGDLPVPTLIAMLESIGRVDAVFGDPRITLPLAPKLSTYWEN